MSSAPPSMASRNSLGSTSTPSAKAIVSAMASVTASTQWFMTNLKRVAAPAASPKMMVLLPTAPKSGSSLLMASVGPEANTTNSPLSAGPLVPSTGASTNVSPSSSASAASDSVPLMPTVDACHHSAPAGAAGAASRMTSSTAPPS